MHKNPFKKILYNNRFFFYPFILTSVIMAVGFALIGLWPFGDKTALIVDSIHQYLPFYTDFRNKLVQGGSLFYSFSGGLGYNFWSTYAYYLASPSNLLLYFVPMDHVCDFMDLMIVLRTGFCGGCFGWYIRKRMPESKSAPIAFGVAYGLSGMVLGYYFNLMWLDSIAMAPIIMYGIEKIIRGDNGRTFCVALAYGIWCNYYIGFMLCIFSCIWFLVSWLSADKWGIKRFFKSILVFALYALIAGGMAAILLIPAYLGLAGTEAAGNAAFPDTVEFFTSFLYILKRHIAMLEPVTISDTQEGLNIYCGVGTVFFALLFLFDKKTRLRERVAYILLCAFFYLSFSLNFLNIFWHGLHRQNGLPNRFAFLYSAVLLVMAAKAVAHIKGFRLYQIFLAWAIPAAFCAYYYLNADEGQWRYILSLVFVAVYLLMAQAGRYFSVKRAFYAITSILLILEVGANCIYGVSQNGGEGRKHHLEDQTSYQALMSDKEGFYRSEVDRQWMRNVTMFCGGNSMVMFNSTMYHSVVDFCRNVGIEARTNKNGYYGVTRLMNDLLGIRYILSPSHETDTMYGFRYLGSDGDLTLYENDDALPLGYMADDSILDWDPEEGDALQAQNNFVRLATGHDGIFTYDRRISLEDGGTYQIRIPEGKQVYFYIDRDIKKLKLTTPEYTREYNNFTDFIFTVNGTEDDNMAEFTVELDSGDEGATAYVYTCPDEACSEVIDGLKQCSMENVEVNGSHVEGTVNAGKDGVLLLTIPYDDGWRIYVDGTEVLHYEVGGMLTGIDLTEGEHSIEMKYTPPGFYMGAGISIGSVALLFISVLIKSNRFQRKKY